MIQNVQSQSQTLKKSQTELDLKVGNSYTVAQQIAAKSKTFIDGKFKVECIEVVSGIYMSITKISIFQIKVIKRVTVAKRIKHTSDDIEITLKQPIFIFDFILSPLARVQIMAGTI